MTFPVRFGQNLDIKALESIVNFSGWLDEILLLWRQFLPTQVSLKLDRPELFSLDEANRGAGLIRIMILESLVCLAVDLLGSVDVLHLIKSLLIVALLDCDGASIGISAEIESASSPIHIVFCCPGVHIIRDRWDSRLISV